MSRTRPSRVTWSSRQEVGVQCPVSLLLSLSLPAPLPLFLHCHMCIYLLIPYLTKSKRLFEDLPGEFFSYPFQLSGQGVLPLYGNSRIETDRTR